MARLILFDVDGTLVDSQAVIVDAMAKSFTGIGLSAPSHSEVLSIVGLSLDHAMARLAPEATRATQGALVDGYKQAYAAHRAANGAANGSPLYPGALEMIQTLAEDAGTLLGVATGKSRRGLEALLSDHGLARHFVTRQVADDHPSKPHPSMIWTALSETGCSPEEAVMIGDTVFDMEMAAAAHVPAIGVSWGYHPAHHLGRHTPHVIEDFAELPATLAAVWGETP